MPTTSITTNRNFHLGFTKNGLSNPFTPNKKSNNDTKIFLQEKLQNTNNKNSRLIENEKDSIFVRVVKRMFNPTPLNDKLREKFNLDSNYKLIYLIEKERANLILFNLTNLLFPLFFSLGGFFLFAELTGISQMSKSFENPLLFLTILNIYFGFAYFVTRLTQSRTVFRIYYNEKLDKFVLFRNKGLINFKMEEFTKQNVKYRFMDNEKNQNTFIRNLTQSQGNIYINNHLRQLEFSQFSSIEMIEKLLDEKSFQLVKHKLQK